MNETADTDRMEKLAAALGIERMEPNAGDDPNREYWWNGYNDKPSLREAIDDFIKQDKQ